MENKFFEAIGPIQMHDVCAMSSAASYWGSLKLSLY